MGTIKVIEDEKDLDYTIEYYDEIVNGMESELKSNNLKFNENLEKIVDEMFEGKK